MLSYEEAAIVLDELADELPQGIFEKLTRGRSFGDQALSSEGGRHTRGTHIKTEMGRCTVCRALRRYGR